jgi:hypothetical protein
MSKSKNTRYNQFNEDLDEEVSFSKYNEERKNKRRQKRINAALKTKDINKLMAYNDDE